MKTALKQLIMAVVAALFAANGLLHPLFHVGKHLDGGAPEAAGAAISAAASDDCRRHAPEFVPDFCPVCAGFFAFAVTPAGFVFNVPHSAGTDCPAYFSPTPAALIESANARAPPEA